MTEFPKSNETGKRPPPPHPGLDLVRATEAAALAGGRYMGRDDRHGADHAAQDAMEADLDMMSIKGRIICA